MPKKETDNQQHVDQIMKIAVGKPFKINPEMLEEDQISYETDDGKKAELLLIGRMN